jgi:hypothetical protein
MEPRGADRLCRIARMKESVGPSGAQPRTTVFGRCRAGASPTGTNRLNISDSDSESAYPEKKGGRRSPRFATVRRQDAGAEPLPHKLNGLRIATPSIDDRRAKRSATDCVHKPDRRAADGDRTHGQASDRQSQSERRAARREQQSQRSSTDRHQTARDASDRNPSHCHIAHGDNAFRDSRTHRQWIDACAHMNERPASNRDGRPILEPEHCSLIHARTANNPRSHGANALATDSLLAKGTDPHGRRTIVHETVHRRWPAVTASRPARSVVSTMAAACSCPGSAAASAG